MTKEQHAQDAKAALAVLIRDALATGTQPASLAAGGPVGAWKRAG